MIHTYKDLALEVIWSVQYLSHIHELNNLHVQFNFLSKHYFRTFSKVYSIKKLIPALDEHLSKNLQWKSFSSNDYHEFDLKH